MKDAIGQPVPRKEDLRLITGRGTYVSDLQLPRTKHVAFLRSPHAHARISAIDASQARELAGVRAVFTGDRTSGQQRCARSPPCPVTSRPRSRCWRADKARFAGEAVAAVVADSRYLAEDALALIDVDYVPLPVTVIGLADRARGPGARRGAGQRPAHPDLHGGRRRGRLRQRRTSSWSAT